MATLCMALAVRGFLALLGWGSFLAADDHLACLILGVIIVDPVDRETVLQWRETRRFPRSTGAVVAVGRFSPLLSIVAPSWPWLAPGGVRPWRPVSPRSSGYLHHRKLSDAALNERDLKAKWQRAMGQ